MTAAPSLRPAAPAHARRSPGLVSAVAMRTRVEMLQFYREPLQVFFGFAFPATIAFMVSEYLVPK